MRRVTGITLLALVALAVGVTLAACGAKDIANPTTNIDVARDQAAKSQIMLVKTGIAAYTATNGTAPPMATQEVLGTFVDPWPKNPWTEAPMAVGKTKGDLVYAPGAGTAYTIGVVLSDGSVYNAP